MANRVGQQIGNYRLLKLLGTGAFAEVYLGEHILLEGRQVAIKVLRASLPPEYEKLFLEEAKTVAKFQHPHIVQLIDFGIQEGLAYLIMQYAPNGSLRSLYPKGSVVPLVFVVPWVNQVADALQYTHDRGIIHRDVKPANILLSENNELLLADFGVATIVQETELMKTGHLAGTPSYSAPEQHRGKSRRESDQYALATMVYEWLCGSVPFEGNSLIGVALKHLQEIPQPLHERGRDIPLVVEAVVMKALAKEAKDRFGSVREFALALQQAAGTSDRPPEAETTYPSQPAVIDNKAVTEVLMAKGYELFSQERYKEALPVLDQAISLDPKLEEAYVRRGITLSMLGRLKEALAAFDQAISLDPQDAWAYHMKGAVLHDLGRLKEALPVLDQAISLDPQDANRYYIRGLTLDRLRRREEALADFNQAIRLDPKLEEAYYIRGRALLKFRKYDEALADFNQMIRLDPQDARGYYEKGFTLYKLGRDEEARQADDLEKKYRKKP